MAITEIPQVTIEEKYADQTDSRIRALNILAGYYIERALKATDDTVRDEFNNKANQVIHFQKTI